MKKKIHAFFRSLRFTITVSYLLPIVIIFPLVILAFSYATRSNLVMDDVMLIVFKYTDSIQRSVRSSQAIWTSPELATEFITRIQPDSMTEVVLYNPGKKVISGNFEDPTDYYDEDSFVFIYSDDRLTSIMDWDEYAFDPDNDKLSVVIPVHDDLGVLLGTIRLIFPAGYFQNRIQNSRLQMYSVLTAGLLISVLVGIYSSRNVERQISAITQAISDLSSGLRNEPLAVIGSDDIQNLAISFNNLAGKLKESEESRSYLITRLTHELGRPLGALLSASEALQRGAGRDETLSMSLAQGMTIELKRLQLLVGDLSLLRESTNTLIILENVDDVSLLTWLEAMAAYWGEFSRSKDITFTVDLAPDLPVYPIDKYRFSQAIGNLMTNAIKYTKSGGLVRLKAIRTLDEVQISVSDNGRGISPEDIPHLFKPFYRGRPNRRIVQGMGIGLSIAQEVITAHNGVITVESELGKGSTFMIHLPLTEE